MAPNERQISKAKIAVGSGIAAALALAVPIVSKWEGKRNDPYEDKFVKGLMTVCYGETRVKMQRYTDEQCKTMLLRAMQADYAEPIAKCVPQIANRPYQLAAMSSLAYNAGVRGVCNSTAAKRMRAGDYAGGCKAIARWNMAGGRVVQGLVNRRADEVRLCMSDL